MIITKIELVKYNRIQLNQITEFVMDINEIKQLILGTNGSGKSSLIKELSPLPITVSEYKDGGYKQIWIDSNNSNYVIKSTKNTGHSITKDGVELNKGGTITTFKEIVKQEFGITQEIHDLIIGLELFHSMSSSRRREWFTKLSDINFDYALKVYNSLKERIRDAQGALKRDKARLVVETAKVVSTEEEISLRKEADLIINELNLLMEQSAPIDNPVSFYKNDITNKQKILFSSSEKLLRMRCVAPYGTAPYGEKETSYKLQDEFGVIIKNTFTSVEDINEYINELSHKATALSAVINEHVSLYNKIDETIKILIKTGDQGIKSIHNKMMVLEENKEKELGYRKYKFHIKDPVSAINAIDSIYDNLVSIFSEIPVNNTKEYSQAAITAANNSLFLVKENKRILSEELVKLNAVKAHLETHKANGNIKCPNCNYVWTLGYSDEKYADTIRLIENKNIEITEVDKNITEIETKISSIYSYFELYKGFTSCVKNWPILQTFWDYLINNSIVINSPRLAISILDGFKLDLKYEINAHNIDKELNELLVLLKSAEKIGDASLTEQKEKLQAESEHIAELTASLNKIKNNISEYTKYRNQLVEALELDSRIKDLIESIEQSNEDMVEMIRRETISHCIRQLQQSLALKESTLSAIKLQKQIVSDLDKQVKSLTEECEAIDLLMDQLSPTKGIIAEGLLGFIRSYIGKMNKLLKKIWTYPLVIKDCNVSEDENSDLDYKFPMLVGNNTNIVSDVKFGSSGIQQIIDIAFRVTAMQYLGLENSPLFLDEYSSSFDMAHKQSALNAIISLLETSHITQLFMVSHNYSEYGCFNNLQVCVLDSRNIITPSVYNEHVKIR